MYLKIIRRGLYNLRDSYLIYILSSSFAVAVLTLLAMLVQDPTLKASQYWNQTFRNVTYAMVFVFAFFTFVYMAYVGGFFIEQQKQEFRTYKRLGMSRWIIAIIGFLKTFVVQLMAWILGMLVALVFEKFIGMLLVYLMRIHVNFAFFISWEIIWLMVKVGLYSTIVLSVINGLRSYWIVRNSSKKNRFHLNWFLKSLLGIVGLMMFLTGIGMTVNLFTEINDTKNIDSATLSTVLIAFFYLVGSYFIFQGFLPLLLDILDRVKVFSYRGLNLFSFKYLRKRLVQNTSIIWFITELSALAVAVLVFCYAGYQVVFQNYQGTYPFELAADQTQAPKIQEELTARKTKVKGAYHSEIKRTVSSVWDYSERQYTPRMISLMSYSDYQKMPKHITRKNPVISPNDFLELKTDLTSLTPNYRSTKYPVKIKNAPSIKQRKVGSFFPYGTRMFSGFLMIVPDQYFHKINSEVSDTFYGWDIKGSDKLSNKFVKNLDKKNDHYVITVHVGSTLNESYLKKSNHLKNKIPQYNQYVQEGYVRQASTRHILRQATGFFLFLISTFSIALLIALGSLLTLKVLLRDDYEWRQLKTLKKIGASNQELKQIVKRETRLLFGLPMIFSLVQSFLVVGILNLSISMSMVIPFLIIGISYLALYGLTGVLTFILSWRGVKQKI